MEDPGFEGDRPDEARDWNQLGILVLDGSISMTWEIEGLEHMGITGSKAAAVNLAVKGLFNRFFASRKRKNFYFAVVKFHDYVSEEIPPTRVIEIDRFANYDPTSAGTGETFIGSGLEKAHDICEQYFADHANSNLPTEAVVLLMSDGQCLQEERTKEIANKLKANRQIKLVTAFFATKGKPHEGEALLRTICSPPSDRNFTIAYDPHTLREFWIESMEVERVKPGAREE